MRVLPVNTDSFLIELPTLDDTLALYDTLCAAALPGVEELVPAARTVLVHFAPWLTDSTALIAAIAALPVMAGTARDVPQIVVPVRYDGEDLPLLAETLGISVAQLIEHHQSARWKVPLPALRPVLPIWSAATGAGRSRVGRRRARGSRRLAADRFHRRADVGAAPSATGAAATGG